LGRLREDYIETGQVRFVFQNHAVLGPESVKAAEGSECAADQGAFWPYHDRLFADQVANRSRVTDDYLLDLAARLGLDPVAFQACLETAGHDDRVIVSTMGLKARGVRGVPGFLINGQYIAGNLPYDTFQELIEQALTKAGRRPAE
jgi:protein-disulfide isomerase